MWDKNPQPREQQKEIMAKHKFKCSSCGAGSPETFLFIREDSSCTRKKRKGSGDNLVPLCGFCAGGLITDALQEQLQVIMFVEWLRDKETSIWEKSSCANHCKISRK